MNRIVEKVTEAMDIYSGEPSGNFENFEVTGYGDDTSKRDKMM